MLRISLINQLLLVSILACFPLAATQAIIIRHDKADSLYRIEEQFFPQLFFLHTRFDNKVCVATLISSHWAITAAHCTRQTPLLDTVSRLERYQLTVAGHTVHADRVELHPLSDTGDELKNVDLALIHLADGISDVVPARLNRGSDELGQVFSLVGWGYSGIGTRGLQGNDGRLRRAKNRVSRADQWLEFRFDDPREPGSQALDLEGVPGLGDSGGPALLETGSAPIIMGIAVGELEQGPSPAHQGLYGATQLYERISTHMDWIEQVMSAQ